MNQHKQLGISNYCIDIALIHNILSLSDIENAVYLTVFWTWKLLWPNQEILYTTIESMVTVENNELWKNILFFDTLIFGAQKKSCFNSGIIIIRKGEMPRCWYFSWPLPLLAKIDGSTIEVNMQFQWQLKIPSYKKTLFIVEYVYRRKMYFIIDIWLIIS